MDKKGTIVTYLPFKQYLIVMGIIAVVVLIFYWYFMHYLGIAPGLVPSVSYCPEGIIPDRIKLECSGDICGYDLQKRCSNAFFDCGCRETEDRCMDAYWCYFYHYENCATRYPDFPESVSSGECGDTYTRCINECKASEEIRCKPLLWADGTPIGSILTNVYDFERGKKEGENINYFYNSYDLYYTNQPINPDGTIGKKITLSIDLVINPSDETKEGFKVIQAKCRKV
ncbi:MAG: hypothetical protein Q8N77_01235 [Nanoarchaeota archaeon]|nr:hypothetical protein [Nanoarchaeota archaeon]